MHLLFEQSSNLVNIILSNFEDNVLSISKNCLLIDSEMFVGLTLNNSLNLFVGLIIVFWESYEA